MCDLPVCGLTGLLSGEDDADWTDGDDEDEARPRDGFDEEEIEFSGGINFLFAISVKCPSESSDQKA